MAILRGLFLGLFGRGLNRWWAALAVVLALVGYTLLRTDQNGWIELSTDGEQLWVEVERK